jgi:5-methyltetrahydrofolate--homocysteine methyltransferase
MFSANRSDDGEDVELYEDEAARAAGNPMHTFCMLRQQAEKENDESYLSQADFVAPKGYESRKHYARMDLKPLKDLI